MPLKLAVTKIQFHLIEYHILFQGNDESGPAFLYRNHSIQADRSFIGFCIDHIIAAVVVS